MQQHSYNYYDDHDITWQYGTQHNNYYCVFRNSICTKYSVCHCVYYDLNEKIYANCGSVTGSHRFFFLGFFLALLVLLEHVGQYHFSSSGGARVIPAQCLHHMTAHVITHSPLPSPIVPLPSPIVPLTPSYLPSPLPPFSVPPSSWSSPVYP